MWHFLRPTIHLNLDLIASIKCITVGTLHNQKGFPMVNPFLLILSGTYITTVYLAVSVIDLHPEFGHITYILT